MSYSFERILHQLIYNRKRYVLLWLELLAGAMMLSICTNLLFTSQNILEEYSRSMESEWVDVENHTDYSMDELMNGALPTDFIAVSYESYVDLKEKYGDHLVLAYTAQNSLTAFCEDDVVEIELIFMSDSWFAQNFGTDRMENIVYVGANVREGLKMIQDADRSGASVFWSSNQDTGKHPEVSYDGETLKIGNTDAYQISEIPFLSEEKQSFNPWLKYVGEEKQEGYLWLEDCVIFPVEAMADIDQSEVNDWQVFLRIAGQKGAVDWNALMSLYQDIQAQAPERCSFTIGSEYLEMEKYRRDLDWNAWYWMRISGAAILLVLGSMTGVLLVMLYQRRRQKAVACVCGSTQLRLELEMMAELLAVLGTAAGIGDAVGRYLIVSERITYGAIRYDGRSSVILLTVLIVMLILVYGINHALERRISWVQILKGE